MELCSLMNAGAAFQPLISVCCYVLLQGVVACRLWAQFHTIPSPHTSSIHFQHIHPHTQRSKSILLVLNVWAHPTMQIYPLNKIIDLIFVFVQLWLQFITVMKLLVFCQGCKSACTCADEKIWNSLFLSRVRTKVHPADEIKWQISNA